MRMPWRKVSDTEDFLKMMNKISIDELASLSPMEFIDKYCEHGVLPLNKYRFKAGHRNFFMSEIRADYGTKEVTLELREIIEVKSRKGRLFSQDKAWSGNEIRIILK